MLVACFDLFKRATQCVLKFVELLRTQGGNTTFDISFDVWVHGTEREPSETGRHFELQRGKGRARATTRHCRRQLAEWGRSSRCCFNEVIIPVLGEIGALK